MSVEKLHGAYRLVAVGSGNMPGVDEVAEISLQILFCDFIRALAGVSNQSPDLNQVRFYSLLAVISEPELLDHHISDLSHPFITSSHQN